MPWTADDVTMLRAAILLVARTGQRTQFGTRVVERANLAEMRALLADMEAEVNATASEGRNYRLATYDKGV